MNYDQRVATYVAEGMDRDAARVRAYEDDGCTTSDAQAVVDGEDQRAGTYWGRQPAAAPRCTCEMGDGEPDATCPGPGQRPQCCERA